jgi:hypothetical protein
VLDKQLCAVASVRATAPAYDPMYELRAKRDAKQGALSWGWTAPVLASGCARNTGASRPSRGARAMSIDEPPRVVSRMSQIVVRRRSG